MVENRPFLVALSHAVLVLGVLAVAFPLYVTFVASTHRLEDIMQVPMPLLPGDQLVENYSQALAAGSTTGSSAPVARMLLNSSIMALAIARLSATRPERRDIPLGFSAPESVHTNPSQQGV